MFPDNQKKERNAKREIEKQINEKKTQHRRRPHPSANQSRPAVRIHRNTDRYWQKRKQNNEEKELQEKQKRTKPKRTRSTRSNHDPMRSIAFSTSAHSSPQPQRYSINQSINQSINNPVNEPSRTSLRLRKPHRLP